MNTEDERRDEQEAQLASRRLVHLEGDIITANGAVTAVNTTERKSLTSNPPPPLCTSGVLPSPISSAGDPTADETSSVCTCSCYRLTGDSSTAVRSARSDLRRVRPVTKPKRYTVIRTPVRITHLVPADWSTLTSAVTPQPDVDSSGRPKSEQIGSATAGDEHLQSNHHSVTEPPSDKWTTVELTDSGAILPRVHNSRDRRLSL